MSNAGVTGPGRVVTLHFTISLEDGQVVETTRDAEPMVFTHGSGEMDAGLESLLTGYREGDREQMVIAAGIAFGEVDEANIHSLPRSEFADDLLAGIGEDEARIIEFTTPSGDSTPGRVLEWNEQVVKVDFNHPLAGKVLNFEFEVVRIV